MLVEMTNFLNHHISKLFEIGVKLLVAILLLVLAFFISKAVKKAIAKTNERFHHFDATLVPIFSTTASYLIYIIATIIILDSFGVNTTSIIAVLGAAGLAIALALKDTLGNIAAGLMLIFLRPFRVGDYIECGNISGVAQEVGLFTTSFETVDGLHVSTPNGLLWGAAIKNFNRNSKRRMDLTIGIDYSDSIDKALEILQEVAQQEKRFLEHPKPQVLVQSLGNSSVNLVLRGWTTTDNYWNVFWDQTKNIKEKIQLAGLTIPIVQQDILKRLN